MLLIKIPTGEIFAYTDCEIFEGKNMLSQKELAKILFSQSGILVAEIEGGENNKQKE